MKFPFDMEIFHGLKVLKEFPGNSFNILLTQSKKNKDGKYMHGLTKVIIPVLVTLLLCIYRYRSILAALDIS